MGDLTSGEECGDLDPEGFQDQVTVTDDFSSGSIRFVVATVPPVVEANTYKVGLANNSIGPHVLVAVGGLPEGITVNEYIQILDAVNAGAPPRTIPPR
jgi:hypothetical protein